MKVTLDYSQGSLEGKAIYLNITDGDGSGSGFRVAGPKCWGYINPVRSFELDEIDLENLIKESKSALKILRTYNKRRKKK